MAAGEGIWRTRKLWAWLALVGTAVAATLAVVLISGLLRLQGTDPPSSPDASASSTPIGSSAPYLLPSSSAAPTESSATPVSADLEWTETGSFGGGDGFDFATAVARSASGFVAVGTHYIQRLDPSGPLPPHEGRIWQSPDGRSWTDVTPPDTFANAAMDHVFTTLDGALIAIGRISNPDYDGDAFLEPLAAWESNDGRGWERIETGLPADLMVTRLAHGARGYVAGLWDYGDAVPQLWLSADGRHWEQTYTAGADERLTSIGAGEQGFVAVGLRGAGSGDSQSTLVIASSDGRDWVESSSPPANAYLVAPTGPDWIAIGPGPYSDYDSDVETPVSYSANGLEWREIGTLLLHVVRADGQTTCREFVSGLNSADGWLLVGTAYSYPCSEGGVVGYGSQQISVDATAWQSLPFVAFSYESQGIREDGSIVLGATGASGGLALVGQSNGHATFWFGEPR